MKSKRYLVLAFLSFACGGGASSGGQDTCPECISTETGKDKGNYPDYWYFPDYGPVDEGQPHDLFGQDGLCRDFGCLCTFNSDCDSGWCVLVNPKTGEKRCTIQCFDECPEGWGCQQVGLLGQDPLFLCVPNIDPLCNVPCLKDGDCGYGNLCVKMEKSQFCLRQCTQASDCPTGYECREVWNYDGSVHANQCVPVSGHCLCGPDVDYQSDVNHCGSCENACSFPHGVPTCIQGTCRLVGCEEGYFNLNGKSEDGCEYPCVYQGPEDDPDPEYIDSNCDGIDGVVASGVFVDAATGDDDNDIGDMSHPFKTIGAAIAFAAKAKKPNVYVSKGEYREQVVLVDGISLYGGYDAATSWSRNVEKNWTVIAWDGQEPYAVRAVVAINIISRTVFDGFYVRSGNAYQASASSYGIYVFHASNGLIISHNVVEAGNGGDGKNGTHGLNGLNGSDGGDGSFTFTYGGWSGWACDAGDFSTAMRPGKPGKSPCGNRGGRGGEGGKHEEWGKKGEDAPNGGGAGGGPGSPTKNGWPGSKGKDGANGKDGAGGKAKGLVSGAGLWLPDSGKDGEDGQDGTGGGGGGGGGGDDSCCCDSAGGAGGGGGGGGCGGKGGQGGTGGGSSFGIFVLEASPVIQDNIIISGSGGNGGNGGMGGKGGEAGLGGEGGRKGNDDNAGYGGNGGDGGRGGDGGSGGGGAGGSTFPIYVLGQSSNPKCSGNTLEIDGFPGVGGMGGSGSSNSGENGLSGPIYGATPSCKP